MIRFLEVDRNVNVANNQRIISLIIESPQIRGDEGNDRTGPVIIGKVPGQRKPKDVSFVLVPFLFMQHSWFLRLFFFIEA